MIHCSCPPPLNSVMLLPPYEANERNVRWKIVHQKLETKKSAQQLVSCTQAFGINNCSSTGGIKHQGFGY